MSSVTGAELSMETMYRVCESPNQQGELQVGTIVIPLARVSQHPDGTYVYDVAILMTEEDDIREYGVWHVQEYDLDFEGFRFEIVYSGNYPVCDLKYPSK